MRTSFAALAASAAAIALVAGCSTDSTDSAATSTPAAASTTTTSVPTTTPQTLDLSRFGALPAVPQPTADTVSCTYAESSPAIRDVTAPPADGVDVYGTVELTMTTEQGPIGLALDRTEAPCTVNSFVSLAQQSYFDDTPCHRLTTSAGLWVLQCGDPSGQGTRGPGYQYANEYPTTAYTAGDPEAAQPVVYPRGTLAMANSGPDTNGSQFFLVYEDSVLPPQYTVFGTISDEGLATLDTIAAAGVASGNDDGPPASPVTIQTVA